MNSVQDGDEGEAENGSLDLDVSTVTNKDVDDVLVCPSCFEPILPHAHLCHICGAPVSARAMIDPFASIWGEGYAYRQATDRDARPSRIVLIGIWLLFFPGVLMIGILLLEFSAQALSDLANSRDPFAPRELGITTTSFGILGMMFLAGIQIAILIRVTNNYLRGRMLNESNQ